MEVIHELTIPNALKNTEEKPSSSKGSAACERPRVNAMDCTMFVSGDWENFTKHIDSFPMNGRMRDERENRFDVILTADTLYNETAVKKMVDMIISVLAPGGAWYACIAVK